MIETQSRDGRQVIIEHRCVIIAHGEVPLKEVS